jgi:hypothetical protein
MALHVWHDSHSTLVDEDKNKAMNLPLPPGQFRNRLTVAFPRRASACLIAAELTPNARLFSGLIRHDLSVRHAEQRRGEVDHPKRRCSDTRDFAEWRSTARLAQRTAVSGRNAVINVINGLVLGWHCLGSLKAIKVGVSGAHSPPRKSKHNPSFFFPF